MRIKRAVLESNNIISINLRIIVQVDERQKSQICFKGNFVGFLILILTMIMRIHRNDPFVIYDHFS